MRISLKARLLLALAAVALLGLPTAADGTLSYTEGTATTRVYFAGDDGSAARQIGLGRNSHVSPDGETVIYEKENGAAAEMRLYSIPIHKGQRLLNPWNETSVFAWSSDSRLLAAVRGRPGGPGTLLLINLETGARTKIDTGYFNGVSFSPGAESLVYGKSRTERQPLRSDLYRYEYGAFTLGPRGPIPITRDHNSSAPLWGPDGQIAFVRGLEALRRKYAPKNEIFLLDEESGISTRLTETTVGELALGLTPIAWSESGRGLLAEFGGQDQSYAVAVFPVTGVQKALTDDPETGFQGAALSPDGKTVLGTTGLGFGGDPHPKVVTVPFGGGRQKVLVDGAYSPSWGG